jgi:hypothetical protein
VGAVVAAVVLTGGVVFALTRGGDSSPTVAQPPAPTVSAPTSGATSPQPGDSPTASPSGPASPTPTETLAPPTALSGVYNVTVTVAHLGSKIIGVHVGQTRHSSWLLSTDCASKPCTLRLIGESRTGSKIDATGPFQGRTVKGEAESGLQCQESSGNVLFVFDQTGGPFSVHVTEVQRVVGVPQATAFKGSFHFTWVPPAGQGVPGCQRTDETDTVTGTIRQAPAPKPLPPGAPTPPVAESAVIGTWDATLHVVAAKNIEGKSPGDDFPRLFSFIPNCSAGVGCAVTLVREAGDGISKQTLQPLPGAKYAEVVTTTVPCGDGSADYVQKLALKVEEAQVIGGVWRATTMSGAFEITSKPQAGVTGCQPQHELDRISATAQA